MTNAKIITVGLQPHIRIIGLHYNGNKSEIVKINVYLLIFDKVP